MNGIGRWNLVSYLIEKFNLGGTVAAMGIVIGGVVICMVIPYLLGSLNFGLIISKRKYHDDIREHGSGNAGTTNMLRTYGKKAAILTLLGDMFKAFIAVGLGYLIMNTEIHVLDENGAVSSIIRDQSGAALAGLFVMLGHMFPCFYHFKGGKGVATSAIVVLMINPLVFLICFLVFVIIVLGTKFVSLGSIMAMLLYPVILSAFAGPSTASATAVVMAVLVVFMHRENIKRLWAGKESKLSFGKSKKETAEQATEGSASEAGAKAEAEQEYNFITCTGCGKLIPQSRKKCAYCNTVNRQYIPEDGQKTGKRSKKK